LKKEKTWGKAIVRHDSFLVGEKTKREMDHRKKDSREEEKEDASGYYTSLCTTRSVKPKKTPRKQGGEIIARGKRVKVELLGGGVPGGAKENFSRDEEGLKEGS